VPEKLVGDDSHVEIDGIVIRTPDLAGSVSVERAGDQRKRARRGRGRGAAGGIESIDRALRRQKMRTPQTVKVARPRDTARRARRGRQAPPPITLEVPAPRAGREQAVLSIDEHGIATWHFAQPAKRGRRGAPERTRTYRVPRIAAEVEGDRRFPGLGKLIKVVTFPIAQAVGKAARFKVREWDAQRHPPRIRRFGPDGSLTALDDAAWKKLEQGPVLLFVHGTFSTTDGAFKSLPRDTLKELNQRYGGRVIAYDHPTIADDPMTNAAVFLQQVGNRKLQVDVVCHSRGGLVTRSIAERPGDLSQVGPNVTVRTAVLVGATCNGTILASADNWNELVDRATTLLSFLPLPAAVDALETVFALVRSIAVATAKNLEGLDAMAPGGDFLTLINKQPPAGTFRYRAIVSDFEPSEPGLRAWLDDEARDQLLGSANDMMVTIDSMTGKGLTGCFPIADSSMFLPTESIEHANYFGQPKTSEALLKWLPGQA
jgi:pimeloyl-ACP methyl ester carboxylesterase